MLYAAIFINITQPILGSSIDDQEMNKKFNGLQPKYQAIAHNKMNARKIEFTQEKLREIGYTDNKSCEQKMRCWPCKLAVCLACCPCATIYFLSEQGKKDKKEKQDILKFKTRLNEDLDFCLQLQAKETLDLQTKAANNTITSSEISNQI
jgi:hypothetical protein